MDGGMRREKQMEMERCFTCEVRSYLSTGTAGAAALPQLLRHFVLLSHRHTHSRSHTSSHMRAQFLTVLTPPPGCFLSDPSSFKHPSLSSGFPSLPLHHLPSYSWFLQQENYLELFLTSFLSLPSHACLGSPTCLLHLIAVFAWAVSTRLHTLAALTLIPEKKERMCNLGTPAR